jgi:hypothetical protein
VTIVGWRRSALVLGALCLVMQWRACHRRDPGVAAVPCAEARLEARHDPRATRGDREGAEHDEAEAEEAPDEGIPTSNGEALSMWGVRVPAWLMWFAPHPGEGLLDYRDRMAPLAKAAIAPQRSRVARSRDDLVQKLGLDSGQQRELDAAVSEAASQIQDRVMNAALSGELMPSRLKPMAGVRLARDVLDLVDKADHRFSSMLRGDQQASLARHPFDMADYLLFSPRWEQAIGVQ